MTNESTNEPASTTCPACGKTSYHPKDIEYGYCAFCNEFTGTETPLDLMDKLVLLLSSAERADDGPLTVAKWNELRAKTLDELVNISREALERAAADVPTPDQ